MATAAVFPPATSPDPWATIDEVIAVSLAPAALEGGTQPGASVVQRALRWLPQMFAEAVSTAAGWRSPHVFVGPEGHVELEWWHGTKSVTVYIYADRVEYVRSWGPHINNEMDEGRADSAESCRALWLWLMGN